MARVRGLQPAAGTGLSGGLGRPRVDRPSRGADTRRMDHATILTALADPTRRAVLDRLREGPMPVGRIAAALPVTRPAVSQHLKICLEAGLVTMTREGTRNLYALVDGGAAPLSDWLGRLRPVSDAPMGLEAVRETRLSPDEAWMLLCDDLAIWWPVSRVSLSARREGALPQTITLDARPGGSLREVLFDGSAALWATVRSVAPGRLSLDWTLGAEEVVEFAILPAPGGARVCLRHGDVQPEMWDGVLDRYAAAANAALTNF